MSLYDAQQVRLQQINTSRPAENGPQFLFKDIMSTLNLLSTYIIHVYIYVYVNIYIHIYILLYMYHVASRPPGCVYTWKWWMFPKTSVEFRNRFSDKPNGHNHTLAYLLLVIAVGTRVWILLTTISNLVWQWTTLIHLINGISGDFWLNKIQAYQVPSGKRLHNYGKSPCSMGKSTINGPCSIAFCMFTRG